MLLKGCADRCFIYPNGCIAHLALFWTQTLVLSVPVGWVHTGYKGLQRPEQVRRWPIRVGETVPGKLSQRAFAASYAWVSARQWLISVWSSI